MTYTKQTWVDGDVTKPLSAARMNYLENGISANDTALDSCPAVIRKVGGVWPLRSTVTTSTNRRVEWESSDGTQPPTTTGYALPIDRWEDVS